MKTIYQEYLKRRWENSAQYKINYYPLFVERSIELLKEGGMLAFILPDSFLVGKFFSKIRKYILDTCKIREIVFCREDFWDDANVGYPTLLVLQKESNVTKRENNQVTVKLANTADHIKTRQFVRYKYLQYTFQNTFRNRFELYFDLYSKETVEIMRSTTNKRIKDVVNGYAGAIAAPGLKEKDIKAKYKVNSFFKKGLNLGKEIIPYKISYDNWWININKRVLRSGYSPDVMNKPKILVRKTGDSLIAAVDQNKLYHRDTIHSFYSHDSNVCLEWVCLLLNSKILNRFYHIVSMELGRVQAQTDIDQVADLPFIEPSNKVVKKAENLYRTLNISLPDTTKYKKAIDKADTLVANEYGLGEELKDIAIQTVEAKQLASVSSIQKIIKKSHRKRKQVQRKRKKKLNELVIMALLHVRV